MIKKIRRCPRCGLAHEEYAIYCSNKECKCSLMNVIPDEMTDLNNIPCEPAKAEETGTNKKPSNVVSPTEVLGFTEALLEYSGPPIFTFQVKNGAVAGRAGSIDLTPLKESNYISGEHARFHLEKNRWFVENMSETNKTCVNGKEVILGSRHLLNNGDYITMANTTFIFKEKN